MDVSQECVGNRRGRRLDRAGRHRCTAVMAPGPGTSRRSPWIASGQRNWPRTSSFWRTTCSKDARPPRAAATWPPVISRRSSRLLGLEPGGDPPGRAPSSSGAKTFYQQVPIIESTAAYGFTLTTRGGKSSATFTAPTDLIAYSGSEQPRIDINAPVVFVGYGIVAPEYKWNDYAGVDVKGKVVMVMVNDPPAPAAEPGLFAGKALTYYGRWIYKYEEAARQGAAGAILIHTHESATYPWTVVESSWSGAQYSVPAAPGTPVLGLKAWMTEEASRKLAAAGGQDLDALRKAALTRGAKASISGSASRARCSRRWRGRCHPT